MKIRIFVTFSLFVFFLFYFMSCEKDSTSPQIGPLYLIEVMPTTLNIEIDSTYQFSAIGRDVDMNAIEDLTFTWTSRYPEVGIIDQNGLFTAKSSGITFITAKSGTIESAQITVSVYDPVLSIVIQQDSLTIYIDSTAQFSAVGKDINGNDVTRLLLIWETGDSNIATINSEGIIKGISRGKTTVNAKFRGTLSLPSIITVKEQSRDIVTDIEGNVYKTVKIGNQWWMAENLKVTHYRNGDLITSMSDGSVWSNRSSGAYCVYDNNSSNVITYGRLYNWYAVNDSRNIAPEGWHVPTDEEWKQLEKYLGMSQSEADAEFWRGTDEGDKLKSTSGWHNSGNGTDDYGFAALPGGYRDGYGTFNLIGSTAYFWSSTDYYSNYAWSRWLIYGDSYVFRYGYYKRHGFSVRLVRD